MHFKQLDFLNACHYQHLFPKMLEFASKRLSTYLLMLTTFLIFVRFTVFYMFYKKDQGKRQNDHDGQKIEYVIE
jgi:hypothetical protein